MPLPQGATYEDLEQRISEISDQEGHRMRAFWPRVGVHILRLVLWRIPLTSAFKMRSSSETSTLGTARLLAFQGSMGEICKAWQIDMLLDGLCFSYRTVFGPCSPEAGLKLGWLTGQPLSNRSPLQELQEFTSLKSTPRNLSSHIQNRHMSHRCGPAWRVLPALQC